MTLEDIIKKFQGEEGEAAETSEWRLLFRELCQDAIRIGMELNTAYHTPEEIREIMGKLTEQL